jgi:hypothetical protein
MSQTKKLLVPFDLSRPEWNPNEFLVPWFDQQRCYFRSLRNGNAFELGKIVYIGKAISENDLFAKLVDGGTIISDVESTLTTLRSYIDELQLFKIGNIVQLASTDGSNCKVALALVANTPSAAKK